MLTRCNDPKAKNYKNYGGRGIRVCERWMVFENFLSDMGQPSGDRHISTLDRIDNNGNYEPGNCAWRTMLEQGNNKRTNRRVSMNGRTMTVSQWSRETGMDSALLYSRLNRGMSLEQAISEPVSNLKHVVLSDGTVTSAKEWAIKFGANTQTIYARVRAGWTLDRAFKTGPHHREIEQESIYIPDPIKA